MRRLAITPENCSGCKACMIACSIVKEGVINLSKSRIYIEKFGLMKDNPSYAFSVNILTALILPCRCDKT